jgi:hypothetical protein
VAARGANARSMTVTLQEKLIESNGSTEYSLELQGQSFNTIEGLDSVGDGCVPFPTRFSPLKFAVPVLNCHSMVNYDA